MDDYSYAIALTGGAAVVTWLITMVIAVASLVGMWKVYAKAGEPGWAAIVPYMNTYKLFKIAYGNGWKFLFLLVPIANIYFGIMVYVKLAKAFGKGGGYAAGLIFLNPIFMIMLGFDDSTYLGPQ